MYFLAIEITKRKLASTISFLALRAISSPKRISSLARLISCNGAYISFSMATKFSCWATMASLCSRIPDDHFCLRAITLSAHFKSVSLPFQAFKKSLRGIFAASTLNFRIADSWRRISPITSRKRPSKESVCTKGNFRCNTSSAMLTRIFWVFSLSKPFFSADLINLPNKSVSNSIRRATSNGSGPVSTTAVSPSAASSSTTTSSTTGGKPASASSKSRKPTTTSDRRLRPALCSS